MMFWFVNASGSRKAEKLESGNHNLEFLLSASEFDVRRHERLDTPTTQHENGSVKNITLKFIICAALLVGGLLPVATQAEGNRGHHQSGIIGQVNGGVVIATPTGQGSMVIPDHVRVYSDKGKLLAEIETEVTANANWHFDVYLKPGSYTLIAYAGAPPENGGILYSYPVNVTVEKKRFTEVALSFRPL